jgi:hypothetical protein
MIILGWIITIFSLIGFIAVICGFSNDYKSSIIAYSIILLVGIILIILGYHRKNKNRLSVNHISSKLQVNQNSFELGKWNTLHVIEKKGADENVLPEGKDDRNPSYERQLKEDFGLDYGIGGWAFEGGMIIDDMINIFSRPVNCFGALKELRTKASFNKVCIVCNDKMIIFVCNTKPNPTCIISGLDASGISEIIALAIKEGGKVFVYHSTWLLTI